jgi:citronellol/citronellal dehydrogenase
MPGGARGIERVRRKVALAKRTPSSPYACMSPKSLVADAAHYILTRPAEECSGNFFLDDEVLLEACVRDFAQYDVQVVAALQADFFVEALPGCYRRTI